MMFKVIVQLMLVGLATLLSACGSNLVKPVDEGSRDTSGAFDGIWVGETTKTNSSQRHGDWLVNCKDPNLKFNLNVKAGQISIGNNDNVPVTYIDENGRFRFTIETDHKMEETLASEASLTNGNVKIFIDGELGAEGPKGKYIVGVAQFGYRGCTSQMVYARLRL